MLIHNGFGGFHFDNELSFYLYIRDVVIDMFTTIMDRVCVLRLERQSLMSQLNT